MAIVLISAFALPEIAAAASYRNPDNPAPQEFADGMGAKFARGVANIATGWLEFPKQIYTTAQEDGWGRALAVGPVKGVVMMIVRTFSGAAEVLTFPVPYPGFYQPYFDPAFVWQKE